MWDKAETTATGRNDRAESGSATLPPAVRVSLSACDCTDPLHRFFMKLPTDGTLLHQPRPLTSFRHLCPPEPCLARGSILTSCCRPTKALAAQPLPTSQTRSIHPHSHSISTEFQQRNVLLTHSPAWQWRTRRWAVRRWTGSWRSGRFVSAQDRVCHNPEEPPTSARKVSEKEINIC